MRRTRLSVVAALAAAGTSALVGLPGTATAATGDQVQIIAMNDFHGRISPQEGGDGTLVTSPGPDGVYGDPAPTDDVTETVGGAANIATTLAQLRSSFGNAGDSVFVGAGDLVSASPFNSSVFRDEPTIEVLNALGLDYSSVGNHEFDRGQDELYRISGATDGEGSDDVTACQGITPGVDGCFGDAGHEFEGADFPYLAANVVDTATGEPILPPYEVFTDTRGNRVGLIGVVTDDTPNIVSPGGIAGLSFGDEAAAINQYAAVLQGMGVEAIVAMIHEGGTLTANGGFDTCQGALAETPIAAINAAVLPSVDVLVSAHTHVPYDCTLTDPAGAPRLVTQAGFYGKALTDIRLTLTSTGDVDRSASTATNVPVRRTAPDPAIQAIVAYWEARAAAEGAEVVGAQTADLDRAYLAGAPARDRESSLGNLVADAQLAAWPGADVAFMNPGGLRADINCATGAPAGSITFAETFGVQPFSNTVNEVTLTGAGIEQVLEQQWATRSGAASFLQLSVSGLTYAFDPNAPVGSRVDPASVRIGGQPLDLAAEYSVVANSFLVEGGDSFTAFRAGRPAGATATTGPNDVDVLNDYIGAASPVSPPALDRAVSLDPAQPFDDDRSGTGPCDLSATPPTTTPPTATPPPAATPPAAAPPVAGGVSGGTVPVAARPTLGGGHTATGSRPVAADGGSADGALAYTGVDVQPLVVTASLLLLAGGVLTAAGYRRRRGSVDRSNA
ncbi:bifunctional UDP-sugar hydrolase/5'-nucleotidase [Blastococcus sp. URHD0036]|uniref:bifunctional metallophosphatase/5'-nucleotidase n=1 Tax=Blastococcus sp. URHD0036 TaxID=1380356 RepID=UPI0012DD6A67|nr:bifunctional metallophosphatase/5'-nucleotidase [Blastococcus sp. URHD0036]